MNLLEKVKKMMVNKEEVSNQQISELDRQLSETYQKINKLNRENNSLSFKLFLTSVFSCFLLMIWGLALEKSGVISSFNKALVFLSILASLSLMIVSARSTETWVFNPKKKKKLNELENLKEEFQQIIYIIKKEKLKVNSKIYLANKEFLVLQVMKNGNVVLSDTTTFESKEHPLIGIVYDMKFEKEETNSNKSNIEEGSFISLNNQSYKVLAVAGEKVSLLNSTTLKTEHFKLSDIPMDQKNDQDYVYEKDHHIIKKTDYLKVSKV